MLLLLIYRSGKRKGGGGADKWLELEWWCDLGAFTEGVWDEQRKKEEKERREDGGRNQKRQFHAPVGLGSKFDNRIRHSSGILSSRWNALEMCRLKWCWPIASIQYSLYLMFR